MRELRQISNAELQLSDIPSATASMDAVSEFGDTFNGYKHWGSFKACADIANQQKHDTLTELRTCLFFEQRRWHHYGDVPDAEAEAYQRGLVEAIRRKVAANERK